MKWSIRSRNFFELQTGLILLVIGIAGFVLAYFFPGFLSAWMPPCLFRLWSGIPCPACGATHAGISLSRLQISTALFANPLFTLLYMGMGMAALNALAGWIFGKNLHLTLTQQEKKLARIFTLLVIPANWLLLVLIHFFITGH